MKQSKDSLKKDAYYRMLKNEKYNWQKLLLLSCAKLIKLVASLQKSTEEKLFIIDDTNEDKKGKLILVSYINRINHEPQTLGGLFKDLECELINLAISIEFFIQILVEISQNLDETQKNEKAYMILSQLIQSLGACTQNSLGFMCEN